MTNTKHTPGPWEVGEEGEILAGSSEFLVATAYHGRPAQEANARLIAAAPELLKTVKELVSLVCDSGLGTISEYLPVNPESIERIKRARQAIARAEGKGE